LISVEAPLNNITHSLYAISNTLTVSQSVPEPATLTVPRARPGTTDSSTNLRSSLSLPVWPTWLSGYSRTAP